MNIDDIPPLSPALTVPIRTAQDLHHRWGVMMGELGFAERSLWWLFIRPDGIADRVVGQVTDLPLHPTTLLVRNLLDGLAQVIGSSSLAGCSVGFLLSRPGGRSMTGSDRAWARALTTQAIDAGVRLQPTHLATDEELRVFAPDDLVVPATHR